MVVADEIASPAMARVASERRGVLVVFILETPVRVCLISCCGIVPFNTYIFVQSWRDAPPLFGGCGWITESACFCVDCATLVRAVVWRVR